MPTLAELRHLGEERSRRAPRPAGPRRRSWGARSSSSTPSASSASTLRSTPSAPSSIGRQSGAADRPRTGRLSGHRRPPRICELADRRGRTRRSSERRRPGRASAPRSSSKATPAGVDQFEDSSSPWCAPQASQEVCSRAGAGRLSSFVSWTSLALVVQDAQRVDLRAAQRLLVEVESRAGSPRAPPGTPDGTPCRPGWRGVEDAVVVQAQHGGTPGRPG